MMGGETNARWNAEVYRLLGGLAIVIAAAICYCLNKVMGG